MPPHWLLLTCYLPIVWQDPHVKRTFQNILDSPSFTIWCSSNIKYHIWMRGCWRIGDNSDKQNRMNVEWRLLLQFWQDAQDKRLSGRVFHKSFRSVVLAQPVCPGQSERSGTEGRPSPRLHLQPPGSSGNVMVGSLLNLIQNSPSVGTYCTTGTRPSPCTTSVWRRWRTLWRLSQPGTLDCRPPRRGTALSTCELYNWQ